MIELTNPRREIDPDPAGDGMKFTLEEVPGSAISIKVIGCGGCGGNIVDFMIESGVGCVDFACVNTDEQALESCPGTVQAPHGAAGDPRLRDGLEPRNRPRICVGEHRGTHRAAGRRRHGLPSPRTWGWHRNRRGPCDRFASQADGSADNRHCGQPFSFEGKRRTQTADAGLDTLLEQVDTAIVIPNERLLDQIEAGSGFFDGFRVANQIATQTLEGITDLITKTGIMNSDFADVRAVFQDAGIAVVGSAQGSGREAAMQAARDAIGGPVMEHEGLSRASKVLVNITGSGQFGMHDASEALQLIQREIATEAI